MMQEAPTEEKKAPAQDASLFRAGRKSQSARGSLKYRSLVYVLP